MNFEKICRDIKTLKIQGAENIAIAGLKAISLKRDKKSVKKLLNLRETEPLLRNSVRFVLKDYGRNYGIAMDHLKNVRKRIAEVGYRKFKGKKTARELSKVGIKIEHYIDSGAKVALEKSDVILIGADGICNNYIVNKIGSGMIVDIANKLKKKVYVCGDSWKFCEKVEIEERDKNEIWKNAPKNVEIRNIVFEKIDNKLVDEIISELGIYDPGNFIMKVRRAYPEIFS